MKLSHQSAKLPGQDEGILAAGFRRDDGKFLATITAQNIGCPKTDCTGLGDSPEDRVPGGMAETVVKNL